MLRKYTIAYCEVTSPITEPVTKFGGQPVWLDEPRWPLSRQYGTPMQFICQVAIPADLYGSPPVRMAYLFVTDDYDDRHVAETWKPDGVLTAVILQPGGTWDGPTLPLHEGPSLYRRTRQRSKWVRTLCEFAVDLREGDNPDVGAWDDVDPDDTPAWDAYMAALFEDKIGGVPVPTVNEPNFPDPTQWRSLLQLNTKENVEGDPFFLNFADDSVGYAFLSADRRRGTFLWSR